ncbi:ABC transporter permease [Actinacidiphila glaucinigra]|uniref:FtsX-like permease family protein n=1 Tax=Actinacidiphila glaucinigra TaxID=235986 RepID=UPI002DDC1C3C|nr:FtsX-like permease family protein [Actinacidiphila glaucinigra]WSD57862.1 ABC transporter permease [Actinacidiphila glaucinigra]
MTARLHAWRAALRIAGRDARRAPGRTLLVVGMLALPVLGASAADVTLRSAQLSPEQQLQRTLGQADAEIRYPGFGPILQDPDASATYVDHTPADGRAGNTAETNGPPTPTSAAAVLAQSMPPHARKLERLAGTAEVRTRHGALDVDVLELETADPMARGITTMKQGRHPVRRDEVAVTTHFLTASGLRVGSRLTVRDLSPSYRIVGAYERPGELAADEVNALPGALLAPYGRALAAADRTPSEPATETFLVSVPGGFDWSVVVEANTLGVAVVSRDVTLHPPARSDVPLYRERPDLPLLRPVSARATTAVTVVVLALAEVCLLAGPAFAVGAQRSRRQFGLIGAGGGEGKDIRAVVLAGGLIAGAIAAAVGIVLGVGLAAALRPLFEERSGARFGGLDPHPIDLLGIALLAVLAGLAAAALPALTAARQPVLAALNGRKGVRRAGRRLTVVGLAAFLLGTAIAVFGAMKTEWKVVVAAGSVIAEIGVVAMTPAFMGVAGRLGRRWGLSPRLTLRDAARNRARTAPAVAAVLAAVAGTVTVAAYTDSTAAQDRERYAASLPTGAVSVVVDDDRGRDAPAARTAVARNLPVGVEADVDQVFASYPGCDVNTMCGYVEVVRPPAKACPLDDTGPSNPLSSMPRAELRALAYDWRCTHERVDEMTAPSGVLVGDAKLLKVLGIDDPGAVAALAHGRAVSLDRRNMDAHGRVTVRLITGEPHEPSAVGPGKEPPGSVVAFPAYQVPGSPHHYGVVVVVPRAAVRSAHVQTVPFGAYFTTTHPPTDAQRQKAQQALDNTGADVRFHLEEGPEDPDDAVPLALAIFAAIVTLGAAGTATGLARSDAETDLATLAAIGAPPRTRRLLSAFQCAVVAATGVGLGAVTGIIPAIGLRLVDRRIAEAFNQQQLDLGSASLIIKHVPIAVPWGLLAVLLVAVPVGTACLAALTTSSRPTTTYRAT